MSSPLGSGAKRSGKIWWVGAGGGRMRTGTGTWGRGRVWFGFPKGRGHFLNVDCARLVHDRVFPPVRRAVRIRRRRRHDRLVRPRDRLHVRGVAVRRVLPLLRLGRRKARDVSREVLRGRATARSRRPRSRRRRPRARRTRPRSDVEACRGRGGGYDHLGSPCRACAASCPVRDKAHASALVRLESARGKTDRDRVFRCLRLVAAAPTVGRHSVPERPHARRIMPQFFGIEIPKGQVRARPRRDALRTRRVASRARRSLAAAVAARVARSIRSRADSTR